MARTFTSGSPPSQYLSTSSLPVSAPPFTVAYWFNAANITDRFLGWQIYRSDGPIGYFFVGPRGDVTGDPLQVIADDGTPSTASTTSGFSANTWQHACGVFASTTSRTAYLNGGSKSSDTASKAPSSLATMAVNRILYGGSLLSGGQFSMADLAIWNVALTDDEIAAMATGLRTADQVRPSALVANWPLGGLRPDNDRDQWAKAYDLTATGSPGSADHPRLWYPSEPQIMQRSASTTKYWLFANRNAAIIG